MNFNWLLIWTVTISCGLTLLGALRQQVFSISRLLPSLLTLGVLGITAVIRPEWAGLIAGAVWALLILLPGLAMQLSHHFLAKRRLRRASFFSWIACLLHPFEGTRDQPLLVKAMHLLQQQNLDAARSLLAALAVRPSLAGRAAFVILTRLNGDWERYVIAIEQSPQRDRLLSDPLIENVYLQALGETGQLERMLYEYVVHESRRDRPVAAIMLNIARMKVAAFCGDEELVRTLQAGPLSRFEDATRQFWIATARQAKGDLQAAEQMFLELVTDDDRQIAQASQRRLEHPVRVSFPQPPEVEALLSELRQSVVHEGAFALLSNQRKIPAIGTWSLVGILVCFFGMEMFHGDIGRYVWESPDLAWTKRVQLLLDNTTNPETLLDMGALVLPPELAPNPYWRVFRAAFLHFGPLHLLMNVLGLSLFGLRLEKAWGALATSFTYLFCAILSIYLMTVIPLRATVDDPYVLVGASGGVMGLIGCLLGYLGYGYMVSRNRLVKREFNLLFFIVLIQMVFDRATPNVSSECHLLGLMIGIVCGLMAGLLHRRGSHNRTTRDSRPISAEGKIE